MDYNNQDIIIARATPIGKSALAIIRLSGLGLKVAIRKIINCKNLKPNTVHLKKINSTKGTHVIDSCMVAYFESPKSFTGEDMIEITCHGNDVIVQKIINEFIGSGVRIAYPGEFSYRALKNGKIDLIQAESIATKINQNTAAFAVALDNIESGYTSKQLKLLRKEILDILSIIEHELDFNEEEINHLSIDKIKCTFIDIIKKIRAIINYSLDLEKKESGYRVSLVGLPNVGKSTLFNRLVGKDRAIVTDIKGTTRDVIESQLTYKGVPINLYDTAGYRKTKDKIEKIGVSKTIDCALTSDILVFIDDNDPVTQYGEFSGAFSEINKIKVVFVKSKCDLNGSFKNDADYRSISSKNDIGIEGLLTKLLTTIKSVNNKDTFSSVALCNARQIKLLEEIESLFLVALKNFDLGLDMDIIASEIKDGANLFDELLGKMTSDEVLNKIFTGFCVGK